MLPRIASIAAELRVSDEVQKIGVLLGHLDEHRVAALLALKE